MSWEGLQRVKISDDDSMLMGELGPDGTIKGTAFELDGKKKKNVGEFELTFTGAGGVDTAAAAEAEAAAAAAAEAEAAAAAAAAAAEAAEEKEDKKAKKKKKSKDAKYTDEFKDVSKKLNTAFNNRDWKSVQSALADVRAAVEKAAKNYNKGIEKGLHNPEGAAAVERFMATTIIQVEANAEADWADKAKFKLTKDNTAMLKLMRQTIKKMHEGEGDLKDFKAAVDAVVAANATA